MTFYGYDHGEDELIEQEGRSRGWWSWLMSFLEWGAR